MSFPPLPDLFGQWSVLLWLESKAARRGYKSSHYLVVSSAFRRRTSPKGFETVRLTGFAAFGSDTLSCIQLRRLDRQPNASMLLNSCQVLLRLDWVGSQTLPTLHPHSLKDLDVHGLSRCWYGSKRGC